jgi:hypothetical protein
MHTLSGFKLRGAIYADKQLLYRRYQSLLLKQKFGNCYEWPTNNTIPQHLPEVFFELL